MNKKTVFYIATSLASATMQGAAQTDEITSLRSELASVSTRLAELEKNAPASPSWTDSITIKGDLRYRYDNTSKDGDTNKNRQRIRARLGAYADVNDFTVAGIQIRTGGTANSGNQTIGDNWDGKSVFFDLAYLRLSPDDGKYGSVTLGKMKYPWTAVSDLIWDGDVNPEGIAYTYSTEIGKTTWFGSAGGFKVQDTSATHDLNLISAQAGVTQPLSDQTKLTVGGSVFSYDNAEDFMGLDFNITETFMEASFKDVLPVPLKVYGNYINNLFEDEEEQGACIGIKLGDAKKGKWETSFDVRRLESNAAPAVFADSDFVGGGTDVKGFRVKAAYNITSHLQLGVTGISGKTISNDTDVQTVLLDLIASF